MKLYYDKGHPLFAKFITKTSLSDLVYYPWTFGVMPCIQSFFYILKEEATKSAFDMKFERDLITLSDGGTAGIDWNVEEDGGGRPAKDDKRPILLMYPGISGKVNNLYTMNMFWEAGKRGFKCGTVIFRGSDVEGIPITSGKFASACAWGDATEITNWVVDRYVKPEGTKTRNIYAYGCSLGAQILANQISEEGKTSNYDGALLYATPWNQAGATEFAFSYGFGIYAWVIGMNVNRIVRR